MSARNIRAAVKRAANGNDSQLARRCGVSQNTIWKARRTGKVSPKLAMKIADVTGGAVSRSDLRPDLWPVVEARP